MNNSQMGSSSTGTNSGMNSGRQDMSGQTGTRHHGTSTQRQNGSAGAMDQGSTTNSNGTTSQDRNAPYGQRQ